MPATKTNYLVVFKEDSQVYGTATESIALEMPPPDGQTLEDKMVLFVTYQPDGEILSAHPLPADKILNAELKYPKAKKRKDESD